MTTSRKLAVINRKKNIYAILFRNAGVAFQFYDPQNCNILMSDHLSKADCRNGHSFRDHLTVYRYFRTFIHAVDAEYRRLKKSK